MTKLDQDFISDPELETGFRLACQTVPESDLRINIPSDSLSTPQRLQVEGQEGERDLNPVVKVVDLELSPPSIEDQRADETRLRDSLAEKGYSGLRLEYPLGNSFSKILRENKWSVRVVVREDEIIGILPEGAGIYGMAVDIGTTKVAIYLLDLLTGEIVDKTGEMNPQIAYGEDVISRISYADQHPENRTTLQQVLVGAINQGIQKLADSADIRIDQIVDAVVVGNTAIHHLFAGLSVIQLALAPYVPSVSDRMNIRAKHIGLQLSSGAYVYLLPNIAGYVGADHSAMILSTELWEQEGIVFAIDIGTNTELSLKVNERILSCSCASGPAFEGAHIQDGMRAAAGAIERIQITDGEVRTYTIEGQPPVGMCGSGILDAVAQLKEENIINEKGMLLEGQPNVQRNPKGLPEFVLVESEKSGNGRPITLTRADINEIQMAKGAIRASQEILMKEAGISAADVDQVIIAGAFGTYIDVANAVSIGMFPDIPTEKFSQIGNAAGMGAVQALLSSSKRAKIEKIIRQVEYIELTTRPEFQDEFMKGLFL